MTAQSSAPSANKAVKRIHSQTRDHRRNHFFIYLVLLGVGLLYAIPFLWLLSTSLKPPEQLFKLPPEWIPQPFVWSNYLRATTFIPFFRYFGNTLYIAIFNVIAALISCSLTAYGFARIRWPGRDALFFVLVATLMIPSGVTLIPSFLIFRALGWIGSFHPLTWPALTGNAFYIFLLRQFFLTIPQELSAAAKIDGADEFQTFWRIILPLARPALAAVALFTFLANWNDFVGPLIYLGNKDQYTLALGLFGFLGRVKSEWGLLMAASAIMISPVLVLFFLPNVPLFRASPRPGSNRACPENRTRIRLMPQAAATPSTRKKNQRKSAKSAFYLHCYR